MEEARTQISREEEEQKGRTGGGQEGLRNVGGRI